MERQRAIGPTNSNGLGSKAFRVIAAPRKRSPLHPLLQLQRKVGNQAVQRLLGSRSSKPKLKLGQPGDQDGEKAERVAERLMRMAEPRITGSRGHRLREQSAADVEESQRRPVEKHEELSQQKFESVQGQSLEDEELLQGKFTQKETPAQFQADVVKAKNCNGMHGPLKAGLAALPGMGLSDIRVYNNVTKLPRPNAWAHAQGQALHLRPNSDKHLPHEVWHTMQQSPGCVNPAMEAKRVSLNDDARLQQEGDEVGVRGLQMKSPIRERTVLSALRKPLMPDSGVAIQRAMKFEIQTVNHVWMVDRTGKAKPVPRKYGRRGASEKGEEQFITTGVSGAPHLRRGDFVEAEESDPSKPSQFVWTYTVIDHPTGKVSRPKKRRNRGNVNRGTYELKYVDAAGNALDVHRDAFGRFQPGPGPRFMRRVKKTKEGSAIELQAETGGFIEFETPKWHRKWSAIKARIEEAQNMTKDMESAPSITDEDTKDAIGEKVEELIDAGERTASLGTLHEWPTKFMVGHLPVISRGGRLLVEIVPGANGANWLARIQVSESLALQEFESLLREHETASNVVDTLGPARTIFDSLKPAGLTPARRFLFDLDHSNLHSFIQMIVYYIVKGQGFSGQPKPAKFAFRLMSRTSFYSIYQTLLSRKEKALFRKLVRARTIPTTLGLTNSDRVLKRGHGGVSATSSANPRIGDWLSSIYRGGGSHPDRPGKKSDLMSRPGRGSAAMGRFEVDTREGKKHSGLVRIEVRGTVSHGGNDQPRDSWLSYARKAFEAALTGRNTRPGAVSFLDVMETELLDE